CPAVIVEEQRGIDSVEVQPHRLRPWSRRIGGGDVEIVAAFDAGGDHVEGPIMPRDRRGKYPATGAETAEARLAFARDRMADQPPVYQVARMEHGHAGKPREGRI